MNKARMARAVKALNDIASAEEEAVGTNTPQHRHVWYSVGVNTEACGVCGKNRKGR